MRTPTSATGKAASKAGRRAFTLIELVVLLVIMGVAAALIVPRMNRSVGRQEIHEAVARLAHTVRTVREVAVSTRQTCAVEFDLDHGAYSVLKPSRGDAGGAMETVQASWLKKGRLPESVRVAEFSTPGGASAHEGIQRVTFQPDGTSSGAMIRLVSEEGAYGVMIHAHNGRVVHGDAGADVFASDQHDLGD